MLRDHEEPHGHHVVILPLVVGAGSISESVNHLTQDIRTGIQNMLWILRDTTGLAF